jgi:hypothetical protein
VSFGSFGLKFYYLCQKKQRFINMLPLLNPILRIIIIITLQVTRIYSLNHRRTLTSISMRRNFFTSCQINKIQPGLRHKTRFFCLPASIIASAISLIFRLSKKLIFILIFISIPMSTQTLYIHPKNRMRS